jgi:hypothetical protein
VTTIHAPFPTEVECKIVLTRLSASRAKDRLRILARAANLDHPAETRSVSEAWRASTQVKLSRNSNQVARGRIRRFESYMPSHAVRSLWARSKRNGVGPTATSQSRSAQAAVREDVTLR